MMTNDQIRIFSAAAMNSDRFPLYERSGPDYEACAGLVRRGYAEWTSGLSGIGIRLTRFSNDEMSMRQLEEMTGRNRLDIALNGFPETTPLSLR